MANSRNSLRASAGVVEAALAAALVERVGPGASLAIALSGGMDSMVLLDTASRLATRHPFALSAIHVHHGLSTNADRWAEFCATQCAARSVPLITHRLRVARERGSSLEASARAARYGQLLLADVDVIALAHHADDQAETLLLQLLRGAGPHGLAAMPAFRGGRPALLRPLLGLARATLAACAAERGLSWIEDESNADRRHARNFLRLEIAPALAARFAGYPATLARAARNQAEAAALTDALARIDAAAVVDDTGLSRVGLAALSPARARNLLRWFLREEGLRPPSEALLAEMLRKLIAADEDARIRIAQDGAEIGCHRGRIAVHAPTAPESELVWHGEPEVSLPGGVLAFERAQAEGLAMAKLERTRVTLRPRRGGERIRLGANRPTHAVKKLLQDAGMPSWQRESLPLIWADDVLAAVPGIGVALAFQAAPGESCWRVQWRPRVRPRS